MVIGWNRSWIGQWDIAEEEGKETNCTSIVGKMGMWRELGAASDVVGETEEE